MVENIDIEIQKNNPQIEMPQYMVCENTLELFDKQVSIFNLNLEELVFEKMFLMFERLVPANAKLENNKIKLQLETEKLLIETDFEKELGKKRTNKDERMAIIKPFLSKLEDAVDTANDDVEFYKNKIIIINDLIRIRRLELKIETDLSEEE